MDPIEILLALAEQDGPVVAEAVSAGFRDLLALEREGLVKGDPLGRPGPIRWRITEAGLGALLND